MQNEERLKKVAAYVTLKRSKGFIIEWPDDLKKEAIYLVKVFGLKKVVETTQLRKPSIFSWKKKFEQQEINSSFPFEESKIEVTKIVANSMEPHFQEQIPLAVMTKEKIEFKIYCKNVAEKIAEKFFI